MFLPKINESWGVACISFNVIKKCFGLLYESLIHLSQLYPEKAVFTDKSKLAKVTLVYKVGDSSYISNHRPILVLPDFSKFLERLIYNPLTIIKSLLTLQIFDFVFSLDYDFKLSKLLL